MHDSRKRAVSLRLSAADVKHMLAMTGGASLLPMEFVPAKTPNGTKATNGAGATNGGHLNGGQEGVAAPPGNSG